MDVDNSITEQAKQAVAQYGTPLYLYYPHLIEQRISAVKSATAGFGIRYAVKTNPNPWLLKWMQGRVESLDVSSAGEIKLALDAGWTGDQLEFTGPAKTEDDLSLALEVGIRSIVVEDISELRILNQLAQQQGKVSRVLVRIAPQLAEEKFGVRLAGRPTQFGVDEDRLEEFFQHASELNNVYIEGLHIYSGSQCLDDKALAEHFLALWNIFKKVITQLDRPVTELVFGAGMGIPYHDGDPELTLSELPAAMDVIRREMTDLSSTLNCYVEVGRYLVGEAGLFLTRVVRIKESRGTNIMLCDGGMNHNLGACGHLGGVSHRHYSMQLLKNSGGVSHDVEEKHRYRVVGPLCTAIDTLALRVNLPLAEVGDLLAVGYAGSYGPTASPLYFISHRLPKEVVCEVGEGPVEFKDVSWLPGQVEHN